LSSFIIFDTVKKNNKTKQKKKKARCSIEYNHKASKLKLILSHLDKYTYTTFPHLYFVYNDGFGFLFNLSWFRLVWFFFFFSLDTLKSITHAHSNNQHLALAAHLKINKKMIYNRLKYSIVSSANKTQKFCIPPLFSFCFALSLLSFCIYANVLFSCLIFLRRQLVNFILHTYFQKELLSGIPIIVFMIYTYILLTFRTIYWSEI